MIKSHTKSKIDVFKGHPFYKIHTNRKQFLIDETKSELPYFREYLISKNGVALKADEKFIDFSSYDYLGMAHHPRVIEAGQHALTQYGSSVSSSRIISGERPIHGALERKLASILDAEDCVVFVSGFVTNETTIGHIYGKRDVIFTDELAHASVMQGTRLSGSKRIKFKHDDIEHLIYLLKRHRHKYHYALIAIEGVYGTEGDIPFIPDYVSIKQEYDCHLMVDEAHSLGVLGDSGYGVRELHGVAGEDVDLWMGTLSKSLASCGGYIAGSKSLIEMIKYTVPGFVFSVGMPAVNAATALESLNIMEENTEKISRLKKNAQIFLQKAKAAGLNVKPFSGSAIGIIYIGDDLKCMSIANRLFKRGVNVFPLLHPAVPHNQGRLRFFFSSEHTEQQLNFTVNEVAEIVHSEMRSMQPVIQKDAGSY